MRIDEWIKEREKRERACRELCKRGPQKGDRLLDCVRRIDRAYLAWCETDRWPVEYEQAALPKEGE